MRRRKWLQSNRFLLLLLTACVIRRWVMLLTGSFRPTRWARPLWSGGPAMPRWPSHRRFRCPSTTPCRARPNSCLGFSEAAYRLPSMFLMGIAVLFIARLATRLSHPGAAWLAVFMCFAMTDFNYFAVDARPCGLGICVTAACTFFLVRWLDKAGQPRALLFLVCAATLWRVQMVFLSGVGDLHADSRSPQIGKARLGQYRGDLRAARAHAAARCA